jgi:hypothetical protein
MTPGRVLCGAPTRGRRVSFHQVRSNFSCFSLPGKTYNHCKSAVQANQNVTTKRTGFPSRLDPPHPGHDIQAFEYRMPFNGRAGGGGM